MTFWLKSTPKVIQKSSPSLHVYQCVPFHLSESEQWMSEGSDCVAWTLKINHSGRERLHYWVRHYNDVKGRKLNRWFVVILTLLWFLIFLFILLPLRMSLRGVVFLMLKGETKQNKNQYRLWHVGILMKGQKQVRTASSLPTLAAGQHKPLDCVCGSDRQTKQSFLKQAVELDEGVWRTRRLATTSKDVIEDSDTLSYWL